MDLIIIAGMPATGKSTAAAAVSKAFGYPIIEKDNIKEGLKRTGGYCPCRLARTPENKCMCKEFRDQIADPDYEGYCHCMLYYKEK